MLEIIILLLTIIFTSLAIILNINKEEIWDSIKLKDDNDYD